MIRAVLSVAALLALALYAVCAFVAAAWLIGRREPWASMAGVGLLVGLLLTVPALAFEATRWGMP